MKLHFFIALLCALHYHTDTASAMRALRELDHEIGPQCIPSPFRTKCNEEIRSRYAPIKWRGEIIQSYTISQLKRVEPQKRSERAKKQLAVVEYAQRQQGRADREEKRALARTETPPQLPLNARPQLPDDEAQQQRQIISSHNTAEQRLGGKQTPYTQRTPLYFSLPSKYHITRVQDSPLPPAEAPTGQRLQLQLIPFSSRTDTDNLDNNRLIRIQYYDNDTMLWQHDHDIIQPEHTHSIENIKLESRGDGLNLQPVSQSIDLGSKYFSLTKSKLCLVYTISFKTMQNTIIRQGIANIYNVRTGTSIYSINLEGTYTSRGGADFTLDDCGDSDAFYILPLTGGWSYMENYNKYTPKSSVPPKTVGLPPTQQRPSRRSLCHIL